MIILNQVQATLRTVYRFMFTKPSQGAVGLPVKTGVRAGYYLSLTISAGPGTPVVADDAQ